MYADFSPIERLTEQATHAARLERHMLQDMETLDFLDTRSILDPAVERLLRQNELMDDLRREAEAQALAGSRAIRGAHEEVRRFERDLALSHQIPPAVLSATESLASLGAHLHDHTAPARRALEEFQRLARMDDLSATLARLAFRHEDWLETLRSDQLHLQGEWLARTHEMTDQIRRNLKFLPASHLAYEAALLRYPFLEQHPNEWPKDFDIGQVDPDEQSDSLPDLRSVRDKIISAAVTGFVGGLVQLAAFGGGNTPLQNTTIIQIESRTSARVAPDHRAPVIDTIPRGSRILKLEGGENFCPVWPSRPLQLGWVLTEDLGGED